MKSKRKKSAKVRGKQAREKNASARTVEPGSLTGLHTRQSLMDATKTIGEPNEDDDLQSDDNVQERPKATLLRSKKCSPKSSKSGQSDGAEINNTYLLRDSTRRIIVLAPVEIIDCEPPYHARKTVAYFRIKGKKMPQQYAISGYKPCAKAHRLVLDSDLWTELVKDFGRYHQHHFRSDGWDSVHGRELGHGFASHAEKQAMLAAAYFLLDKYTVEEPSNGTLFKLRSKLWSDLSLPKEVEIFISDEPCDGCQQFKALLEEYTGITFTLISLTNLAAIKKEKDETGQRNFPKIDSEGFVQIDSASHEKLKMMEIQIARLKTNNEYLRSEMKILSTVGNVRAEYSNYERGGGQVMVVVPQTPQKQISYRPLTPALVNAPKKRSRSEVDIDWTPQPSRKTRTTYGQSTDQDCELLQGLELQEFKHVQLTSISKKYMHVAARRK